MTDKTSTTKPEPVTEETVVETPTTDVLVADESYGFAVPAFDVPDFTKRQAALELAIKANAPDPVITAGQFYDFLAAEPEGGVA